MNNLNSGKNNDLLGLPRLTQMISVRCANDSIDSILIVVFFKKDVYALQWNLMYFFSNLKMRKSFVNMFQYRKSLGIDFHNSYAQQKEFDLFVFSFI